MHPITNSISASERAKIAALQRKLRATYTRIDATDGTPTPYLERLERAADALSEQYMDACADADCCGQYDCYIRTEGGAGYCPPHAIELGLEP